MKAYFVVTFALALSVVHAAHTDDKTAAPSEWEKIRETDDGIATFRKEVPGTRVVAFRGEAIIDAPIARVAGVLEDVKREKEWMADLVESSEIEKTSESDRWEYNRTSTPWPLRDRDFVMHTLITFEKSPVPTLTIQMNSAVNPKMPVIDGVVRGELVDSKFVLKAIAPGKTWFSCEVLADPKGDIPKWVVNLFQKGWPRDTIEGLRTQVAKPIVVENETVKRLMKQ